MSDSPVSYVVTSKVPGEPLAFYCNSPRIKVAGIFESDAPLCPRIVTSDIRDTPLRLSHLRATSVSDSNLSHVVTSEIVTGQAKGDSK